MSEEIRSITFANAIRGFLREHGAAMTDEQVSNLDSTLQSFWRIEDGAIRFNIGDGKEGDLKAAIMAYGPGKFTVSGQPDQPQMRPGMTRTERAVEANRIARNGKSVALAVEAQRLVDECGNPWKPDRINRTHQAIITNGNPNLASRLRLRAGANP